MPRDLKFCETASFGGLHHITNVLVHRLALFRPDCIADDFCLLFRLFGCIGIRIVFVNTEQVLIAAVPKVYRIHLAFFQDLFGSFQLMLDFLDGQIVVPER